MVFKPVILYAVFTATRSHVGSSTITWLLFLWSSNLWFSMQSSLPLAAMLFLPPSHDSCSSGLQTCYSLCSVCTVQSELEQIERRTGGALPGRGLCACQYMGLRVSFAIGLNLSFIIWTFCCFTLVYIIKLPPKTEGQSRRSKQCRGMIILSFLPFNAYVFDFRFAILQSGRC